MTTADQRTRRLEPDARKQQILRCAIQLFGDRPYAAVSTTDLADEAGVTRGLIHHYFGTKRGLYLEVVRAMMMVPDVDVTTAAVGSLDERVAKAVDWFLDTVSPYGKTFVAVTGAEGVGTDLEIEKVLAEADDLAARKVLQIVWGTEAQSRDPRQRAMIRAYGGQVKAAVREMVRDETLTSEEVRDLLIHSLLTIVRDVFPGLAIDMARDSLRVPS